MFKKIIFISFFAMFYFVINGLVYAESEYMDIVYLKNGGKIKGIIIEQVPGDSLKIETSDGNVFVYSYNEIAKIAKVKLSNKDRNQSFNTVNNDKLYLYEERKKSGGAAFALSFFLIPGAGHFYCHEVGRGFMFLGADALLFLVIAEGDADLGLIALSGLLGSRIFEYVDCYSAAKRYNQRLRRELGIPDNYNLSYRIIPSKTTIDKMYLCIEYHF